MRSERTKQCIRREILFTTLHILCLFGPFLYFIPYGYINGEMVSKISMSFSLVVSLILAMFSLIIDMKHRAGIHRVMLWLLIAGVLFCLDEAKTFIWIMTITSIIDELLFVRLKDYYKMAKISNKEIDKRA